MNQRVPPQDLDTERALLGALMLNPEGIYEVADVVTPESFYAVKHKYIYQGMLHLYGSGTPIDFTTLSARLKDTKQLAIVGGSAYLAELVTTSISPSSARHYAEVVQAKGVLRGLLAVAGELEKLGFDEEREIGVVLDEAQAKVYKLASTASLQKYTSIGSELQETWRRIKELAGGTQKTRGVPTGFAALDRKLAGLQKSDLVILAARPSMGKTSLALDIARRAATQQGVPVGIFSLEMSSQQLTERLFAAHAYVDAWKLRTGHLNGGEKEALGNAMAALGNAPIFIDDTATNTVLSMRALARRLKTEKGLGLVVVDYLQLAAPSTKRANDTMVQQVTDISRGLKAMARELDVPVLALSQLSRSVEQRGGKPRLSDLRESGSIEQDADVVLFIHREDKDKRYQAPVHDNGHSVNDGVVPVEIIIAKHRNGPVGTVELNFRESQTRFEEVAQG